MVEITIDAPRSTDIETLSKWISNTGDVALISDLQSNVLTTDELERWLEACVVSTIVRAGKHPIGFATLSTEEAPLPSGTAEICHVIVDPQWRHQFNGSHLVLDLQCRARTMGFINVAENGFLPIFPIFNVPKR